MSMKNKHDMKYHKGAIVLVANDYNMNSLLDNTPFVDKYPNTRNKYFFMRNNYGAVFFRDNRAWFEANFNIPDEVYDALAGPIDYTGKREEVMSKTDLPGIILDKHQEIAVDKMLKNHRYMFPLGCGTGKTLIALTFILSHLKRRERGNYVVITEPIIVDQYIEEGETYINEVDFCTIHDTKGFIAGTKDFNVYVTNYERMVKFPKDFKIDVLIFDESQNVKSMTSDLNEAATELAKQADNAYEMTGTPEDATRDEMLAQLKVLNPWLVPTKTLVNERYFNLNDYYKVSSEKRPDELDEIISKMTYGDESENLIDLPMAYHYEIPCEFKDKRIYNEMRKESLVTLDLNHNYANPNFMDPNVKMDDYIIINAKTPAVRDSKEKQICNGFIYKDIPVNGKKVKKLYWLNENPKEEPFFELIPQLENGVIFTNFKPDIEVVTRMLDQLGRTYVVVHGSLNKKQKDLNVNTFKKNQVEFLVAQAKTAKAGLNLINTTNTVYYSLPDSSIVYDQTTWRVRRRGQTKECHFYSFVTKGTAEKKTVRKLKKKLSNRKNQFVLYRRDK